METNQQGKFYKKEGEKITGSWFNLCYIIFVMGVKCVLCGTDG